MKIKTTLIIWLVILTIGFIYGIVELGKISKDIKQGKAKITKFVEPEDNRVTKPMPFDLKKYDLKKYGQIKEKDNNAVKKKININYQKPMKQSDDNSITKESNSIPNEK